MWQFLQTYGIWILFIVFFILMMRMHGGGMHGMGGGCGMGGHNHQDETDERQRVVPTHDGHSSSQRVVPLDEYKGEQQVMPPIAQYPDAERGTLRVEGADQQETVASERYASRRQSRGC